MSGAAQALDQGLDQRGAWRLLWLLQFAYLLSFVDRTAMSLLVEPIKLDLRLSDTQIGLIQGPAFGVLYTLLGLVFGWLADRARRTRVIAGGVLFWSAATAASGLASGFLSLFAARVAVGVGEASLSPSAVSLIADAFVGTRRRTALGIYQSAAAMGGGVALMAGGAIAASLTAAGGVALPGGGVLAPWRAVFILLGVPGAVLTLALLVAGEPARRADVVPSGDEDKADRLTALLWRRRAVLAPYLAGFTLLTVYAYGVLAWAPTIFSRVHGWSVGQTGLRYGAAFFLLGSAGAPVGAWIANALSKRRGDANLLVMSASAGLLGLAGLLAALTHNAWLAAVMFGVLAFLFACPSGVSLAFLQDNATARTRGRLGACYFVTINFVGALIGPSAIGLMNDRLFPTHDGVASAMAVLTLATTPAAALLFILAARRDGASPRPGSATPRGGAGAIERTGL